MKSPQFVAPLLLSAVMFAAPAQAEGDAAAGQKTFAQCRTCHSVDAGKNGLGPSLHGIVGRKAASAEGFKTYSPAMQNSGITWTEENLKKYIADPKGFVPGNRMVFVGLKKPEDVDNVIAYLKTAK